MDALVGASRYNHILFDVNGIAYGIKNFVQLYFDYKHEYEYLLRVSL